MKFKKTKYFLAAFIFLSFLFVGAQEVLAGKAALTWTAPTTNSDGSALTDLGGYKIYWGTSARTGNSAPGGYANSRNVGNVTSYTIDNMADIGTTYFSVVAFDTASPANESFFSSEVHKTPGDVNKSGSVDIFDYNQLKDNFGQTNCNNVADIDLDCIVGIFDYNALKDNFGAHI